MSFLEASRTTLEEFAVYNKAYAIQQEEKRYQAAIQAWFHQLAKATKGKGKRMRSAYESFEDFYNHKEEFDKIFEPAKKRVTLADKNRLLNQFMKGGGRIGN